MPDVYFCSLFMGRNIILYLVFFCLCACLPNAVTGQNQQDSLAGYSYRELQFLTDQNRRDPAKSSIYMSYFLKKAQEEESSSWLAIYYRDFVFYQREEDRLPFIDSALYYAHETNDKALIGSVYLTKATVYYNRKDYQQTLDHYLKANEYIVQTDDTYNKYRVKNHIAGMKSYLGFYEEAEGLFGVCIGYFGQDEHNYNMHRGYISSLSGLAGVYTRTSRITESVQLLDRALASAKSSGFSELDIHYIVFKQGINDYFLGKYDSAIFKIEQKLPFVYENEDFASASAGEFYIGKSWWDKGDKSKAVAYFKKIDEVFEARGYIHPDLREAYELLISYYEMQGNKDQQITYIGQLLKADRVFHHNHKYLLDQIHKRWTTQELIQSKEKLEADLSTEKNRTTMVTVVAVLVLLFVFCWMYYRQRKARKTIRELIRKVRDAQDLVPPVIPIPARTKDRVKPATQLKGEVVEQLLEKLAQFEQKQKFLSPDITLDKLADRFGTNTTYLSNVINTYKKQTFSQYLNGLRIDLMVNEMITNADSVFFKYSVESLAKQLGYKSSTAFSRAFQSHVQVSPSAFIKEVSKENMVG